ncbi:MAG: transposase [Treponema sp.]|nr:transposase [Treponema sp.]
MAYDKKFRLRVIEYKDAGYTFKEVEEAFRVDSKRCCGWKRQLEETASLGGNKQRRANTFAGGRSDWRLREFAEKFDVCPQAVDKMFKKRGVRRKRNFYVFGKVWERKGGALEARRRNARGKASVCRRMRHKRAHQPWIWQG